MNSGPLVFLALFVAMAGSWLGFVMGPELQIGDTRTTTSIVPNSVGKTYPTLRAGLAREGAEVYRSSGCAACHTQQVLPRSAGTDIERGWGLRRSTAYDYLYEAPVMLGSQRIGPDLANAGWRMDAGAVLLHLYEPRALPAASKSIMPAYRYLFEKRKIAGLPSPDALPLTPAFAPENGYEIVPTHEARALAAYVTSLRQDGYLWEAPAPAKPAGATNAPAGTNAPATGTATNSPAK